MSLKGGGGVRYMYSCTLRLYLPSSWRVSLHIVLMYFCPFGLWNRVELHIPNIEHN
jgi:hypothetical protein